MSTRQQSCQLTSKLSVLCDALSICIVSAGYFVALLHNAINMMSTDSIAFRDQSIPVQPEDLERFAGEKTQSQYSTASCS